jgi:hypothetical protein
MNLPVTEFGHSRFNLDHTSISRQYLNLPLNYKYYRCVGIIML